MVRSRTPRAGALFGLLPFLLGCFGALPVARAQDLELRLEPSVQTIRSCDAELRVRVRLSNAQPGSAVSGYQLFVRYPAELFEPVAFEATSLATTLFVAGPAPLGEGFEPCTVGGDPWDDGAGTDVVGVLASALGEFSGPSVSEGSVLLGEIVFRPRAQAKGAGTFSLNEEACHPPLLQTSLLFDREGAVLDATTAGDFAVEVLDGSLVADDLSCVVETPLAVVLSWASPAVPETATALRVYRNGEQLVDLATTATVHRDDTVQGLFSATYEVLWVFEGGVEGCPVGCSVSLVTFIRGDADGGGGVDVSDPVAILGYMFRGRSLSCEDAGDVDDDGEVTVTDAVELLTFLFRSGEPPPPPFPDAGVDPTNDSLECMPPDAP